MLIQNNSNSWGQRPVMSGYCGLQESQGTYLVAELENFLVDDVKISRREHLCRTVVAVLVFITFEVQGVHSDQQMLASRLDMIQSSLTFGLSPSLPQDQLKRLCRMGLLREYPLKSRKPTKRQGRLQTEPQYLDYCAKFSTRAIMLFALCTTGTTRVVLIALSRIPILCHNRQRQLS